MGEQWLVFGGWGIGPKLPRPLFGDNATYVDVNPLMLSLFDNETLLSDWVAKVERIFEKELAAANGIAGWSTGAIIASALALRAEPHKLVLLSATPSFCRREGFRSGWKTSVLAAMRERLLTPGNTVLRDFLLTAGLSPEVCESAQYDVNSLAAGLLFLEQVNLLPVLAKLRCASMVLNGSEDTIVPVAAGKVLADAVGARFVSMPGGHAFFTGPAEIKINQIVGGMPA
jgi:pimeloyl-[acyl-carrier protein] methyl ester esterase